MMMLILCAIFGIMIFAMACEGLGAIIGIAIGFIKAMNEIIEERRNQ